MQVDLSRLKMRIEEKLAQLAQQESRLEESLLTVGALEHLANQFGNSSKVNSSPAQKPEDTFTKPLLPSEKSPESQDHTKPIVDEAPAPSQKPNNAPPEVLEFYVDKGRMPTDEEREELWPYLQRTLSSD